MNMEAYPEAAAVLRDAGWRPHDGWGVYTRDTLVMGFQPDGQAFHVKNWAAIQEGHPQWSADTPDTPEEAAAWLVERFKPVNDLTTEATLDPLELLPEEVENPGDESDGETGEEAGGVASDELDTADDVRVRHAAGLGELDIGTAEGLDVSGDVYAKHERTEPDLIDADFTEGEDLGSELLDVESELGLPPLIEGVEIQSQAFRELTAAEHDEILREGTEPESDQARFYGLDDLDRVRKLRIGDVGAEAAVRIAKIEAEVNEREGEYAAVQSFVVTNLDKFTGAFVLQDEPSKETARRFYALDDARHRIAAVDKKRKEATAYLLTAERDDVIGFDAEAAFA